MGGQPAARVAAHVTLPWSGLHAADLVPGGNPPPRLVTVGANGLGAGGQERPAHQLLGEGGEVGAGEAAGGDGPDVAGILAQQVPGLVGWSGPAQAVLAPRC